MKRVHILSVSLALVLCFVPSLASAKVKVVATLGDLASAAEVVGGELVEVELLADPGEDPHFVDARPSFVKKLAQADLLVLNGMDLEVGWLPTLVAGSRNGSIQAGSKGYFDASSAVQRMGVPSERISRAAGDIHPQGNPHYTTDPRQMARVAVALGKRLGQLDPDNASAYARQADDFAKKALVLANKWQKKFADLSPQCRQVVIYHEAWDYALDWLKLTAVVAIEPKPGVPPNPRHVAAVLKTISTTKAPAILRLAFYPDTIAKNIAKKSGATLVSVQGQSRPGQDYMQRIDRYATELYSALKDGCK